MKVVVIGSTGQLGADLLEALPQAGGQAIAIRGRQDLDIANTTAFAALLDHHQPDAVINTAAFHNVDLCESEAENAYRINTLAVRGLAVECQKRGVMLLQIGTDYVMEGAPACQALPETAAVQPKSIYALTRFGGDCMTLAHAPTMGYVVRTCGLFGMAGCKLKGGLNFVDTMIKAARAGKPLRVVADQIVAPTPTDELARQLILMLQRRPGPGLYHAVAHGQCSWHEFASAALMLAGIDHPIAPVSSNEFAAPARRPAYSVLDNARLRHLGMDIMTDWRSGLKRYVEKKYSQPGG
jgi:dTDP-4-dehydrorhamnose reductase